MTTMGTQGTLAGLPESSVDPLSPPTYSPVPPQKGLNSKYGSHHGLCSKSSAEDIEMEEKSILSFLFGMHASEVGIANRRTT